MALSEAISELCNCSFPSKFLRTGKFRCWNSPNEVTYRSSVVGVTTHNSSQIIGHVESWVRSEVAVVDLGQVSVEVLSGECSVGLSNLHEEECGRKMEGSGGSAQNLSLDAGTLQCVRCCSECKTCGN